MDRRSRFEYDTNQVFEATISSPPWVPVDETIGGVQISAAGIPASYIVRRDSLVEVTLRIREDEWAALLALVAFGQTAQPFTWLPDADEVTSYLVYLHAPAAGERWSPTIDGSYPRVRSVTLVLRGVGVVTPYTSYFPED